MNEVIRTIFDRRSTREFQSVQLKDEELQILLKAGLSAPSANNSQPWHLTVVQDQQILDWIVEKNKEKMRLSDNPDVVKRANDAKTHNFYHAPTVIVFSFDVTRAYGKSDCSNVATQMALAAQSIGVGSCFVASFMQAFNGEQISLLIEKLMVPQGYQPFLSLALGYPLGNPPEAKPRKEMTITYLR